MRWTSGSSNDKAIELDWTEVDEESTDMLSSHIRFSNFLLNQERKMHPGGLLMLYK
jgi:hypothetical protein